MATKIERIHDLETRCSVIEAGAVKDAQAVAQALQLSARETERRLEALNGEAGRITAIQQACVPRLEYDSNHRVLNDKLETQSKIMGDKLETQSKIMGDKLETQSKIMGDRLTTLELGLQTALAKTGGGKEMLGWIFGGATVIVSLLIAWFRK